MKSFLKSVLLCLLLGVIYVCILTFIIAPLLFLLKEGFIGLMIGTVNISDFIRNVLGRMQNVFGKMQGVPYKLDPYSLSIIIVQIVLFMSVCIIAFIFFSKILKELLTGEGEEYFQMFYKIIYFILLFAPETLIFMSLFFKFPVMTTIYIVSGLSTLFLAFAGIITGKVLPDLIKNRDSKFILKGNKNEKNN